MDRVATPRRPAPSMQEQEVMGKNFQTPSFHSCPSFLYAEPRERGELPTTRPRLGLNRARAKTLAERPPS